MASLSSASASELRTIAMAGRPGLGTRSWRLARAQPVAAASLLVLLLLVLMAVFAPLISPHNPYTIFPGQELLAPSPNFLLGTDETGRDVLSRLIYGARISLEVGFLSVGIGVALGSFVGIISGYFEGMLDLVIQRIVDAFMAFPVLILILALITVFGQTILIVFIAIGIAIAPGTARVVRSAVLTTKQNLYIESARTIGASSPRILFFHVLPNVLAPIIVLASIWLGSAILIEASLSFLGLAGPPTTPDWGAMLSRTGRQFIEQAPWLAIAPGLAISITVLAFNLFGDGLRDVLDPRLRGSR